MTDIARRLADLTPTERADLQQRLIDVQRNASRAHTIPRSDAESRRPSSGEARLWFLDQIVGSSALYNISSALQLSGDVCVGAVRTTLLRLGCRHEILRTRYSSDAGSLRIVVNPDYDVHLQVLEVHDSIALLESSDGSDDAVWATPKLSAALEEEAARPFALDRDMLLRAVLYPLGPGKNVLQLTTHHIASDGWSQELLWQEFEELYNAEVRGADIELPELPIGYGDYANWMRGPAKAAELESSADHWSELLRGCSPVLDLPTDHPRPAVQTLRGSVRSYVLSSKAVIGLSGFSSREHATPFIVLLSALFAVLHRYTGQSRILVGSPMAARTVPEVTGIIGFFANTVALPADLSGDPTFRELVAQIRRVALDAYGRQDVPFESVVQRMNPERDSSRSPLVQVMLVLDNYASLELKLDGLEATLREIHTGTSKFDLTIHTAVSQEVGKATIEFNSDVFEPDTIDRFWLHLNNFLENAIGRPDECISSVELLDAGERRMLLSGWNATAEEYPKFSSVAALVEEQVERTPDSIAVVFGDTRLSYRQLNNRANQLAAELIRRGAGPDCAVGLCVERSADMMVALLAIAKTGAAYVPVDPSLPVERANYILSDSGAGLLIAERQFLESVSPFAGEVVLIDADEWRANDSANPGIPIRGDSLAYVIYTSGSTGKPKGVRVRMAALINILWSMRARFGLDGTDRVLAVTTISFDIAGVDIWLPWFVGATTFVADRRAVSDGEELADLIERHHITFLQATPTTWWLLFAAGWKGKSTLQGVSSGETVPRELAVLATAGVGRFWNLYGPTETTIWSTGIVVQEPVQPTCIGRPLGNTQCYVLDAHRQLQPIGVAGELYIAGDGLAEGYQNRPDLTEQSFVPNPFSANPGARMYRTGDLARVLASGDIELIGRADNQIKIRGYRIEPGEIESVLMQHESIRRAVVTARANGSGGRSLVAYVVHGDSAPPTSELRRYLRRSLPEFMIPSAFVVLDALPVTESGKIDIRGLPDPEAGVRSNSPGKRELQNATQALVAEVWKEVLGLQDVGVDDDFFALGGHSLNATQVIARLRSMVQGDFPVRLLFDNPTVASLAAAIDERGGDRAAAPGKSIHMDRDRRRDNNSALREAPLSFVQEQLWLVDQLQLGNTAYVIGCTVEFTGALDPMALRAALTEIVRRHEVLRTSIAMRDGVPVQVIQPAGEAELRVTRLTESAEPDREARAQQIERDESECVFDLTVGSPIRFHLVEVDPEHHRLLVSAHHIALDGWSVQIFIRELGELYAAMSSGSTAVLPEPAWQYADFATWQRAETRSGVLEPLVEYWRNQLDGAPPVNGLALDRPRPAARTFAGGAVSAVIEPETAAGLCALAKESGATLFMTMLAAYKLLLCRLSGERDVVVGVPIAGRTRVETETMLGCFLNTLPFRTHVDTDISFRELLGRVRNVALGAYAHQEVPFDLLVERLNPQRSLSYSPFFQVLFNMLNMPSAPEGLAHVRVQSRDGADASAKFELTMYVQERGDDISLRFVYSTDVYTAAHARVMLQQYCELLNQIVAAPSEPVSEYSLVTPAQLGILPNPAAPQNRDWSGSVAELFAARAASAPDALAVVDGATTWTYKQLDTRGNQLAHHLALLGVAKGDVVAIFAERSAALVWALLAVFKSGGAFVVLDRSYPAQRLADYVGEVRPRVAIALAEAGPLPALLSKALAQIGTVVCPLPPFSSEMTRDELWRCPTTPPDISVSPEDTAYVAFTSGTTGEPKGIVGRHGSLTHFTSWTAAEFGLKATDRYSLLSGLAHDPLHRDVFTPLQLGACVCVPAPAVVYDPARLRTWMRESGITVAHLTPAMGQLLASSSSELSIDSLRLAFFVGDALTRRDVARLHAIAPNVRIVNYYGTTETQRAVSLYVTRRAPRSECGHEVVPLGHGLPDVQLLLVTPAGRLAGIGELGEIYVRSPHIAKSYFGDEQLTLERFVVNPITREAADMCYRTGDLGRYDSEGDVVAAGRADAQVKIRGFRVELAEIEATLGRHPLVSDCVVTAPIAAGAERRLAAYIVARAPAPTPDELRALLRERLPTYMNVSSFTFLDSLPLTPNGKTDRRALPSPQFDSVSHSSNGYAKGPVELELARLWQDLLHVPSVGVDDDFFDLGGHSLLAAAMMQRVATMFGMNPPLSTLFEEPTIRHLANSLRKDAAFIEPGAICIQRGLTGRTPLFYFHGDYTGGGLYCRKLIKYLDRDMPMYVIAPHEAGGPETIESMASDLLPHIREIQQHGPYVLAGYCNGGVVALEVAAQLRKCGETVEFLAVIDVGVRNVQLASLYALLNRVGRFLGFDQRRQLDTFMLLREPALRFLDTELPPIDTSSGFGERAIFTAALISLVTRRVIRRAWRAVTRTLSSGRLETTDPVVQREPLHPDDRRRLASSQYISRAMLSYVPRQYDSTITVIGATEGREDASMDHLHNWRSIAKRVDAFVIPGTHLGIVTSDIVGLGELLRAQIPRI